MATLAHHTVLDALTTITTVWNLFFSSEGLGELDPLSISDTASIVGVNLSQNMSADNEPLGLLEGHTVILRWFALLNNSLDTSGTATLFWKHYGLSKTTSSPESMVAALLAGVDSGTCVFVLRTRSAQLAVLPGSSLPAVRVAVPQNSYLLRYELPFGSDTSQPSSDHQSEQVSLVVSAPLRLGNPERDSSENQAPLTAAQLRMYMTAGSSLGVFTHRRSGSGGAQVTGISCSFFFVGSLERLC
eukprot:TRINITY_DN2202_c0_g1_i4.p1 TRINITY_DN2202_c0_g1~~TRINITY_DN2202_c0_g1_i4.p1  ORF type:complete len:256 (-),score=34.36 TRINITY_DN2202_c0_g1_i4:201-932(-)